MASAASTIVLVVLAAALFAIALAPQMGIRATILTSGSMAPTVPAGGMIAVEEVVPDVIEVGDVITYQGYTADRLVTHRVLSLHDVQGELHFRTQGDANEFPDGDLAPAAGVVGRMRWDLTPVGPVLAWLTGSRAKLLIPGLAGLWLALGEVREMRRSRRPVEADGQPEGVLSPTPAPPRTPPAAAPTPTPNSSSPLPSVRPAPAVPPAWLVWSATAPAPPPPPLAPPAPGQPSAAGSDGLSWSAAPASARVAAPAAWRHGVRAATVGLATVVAVATLQVSAASFFDSAAVSAAAISTTAVDAPTGASATFDCGQSTVGPHAVVTWNAVANADGYEVRRRAGSSGDFAAVGTTTGSTSTSLTDATVALATTYEYVVVATAWSWESEASTPRAQVTTAAAC